MLERALYSWLDNFWVKRFPGGGEKCSNLVTSSNTVVENSPGGWIPRSSHGMTNLGPRYDGVGGKEVAKYVLMLIRCGN